MKKLLILAAFVMLLCYVGRASAMPVEEWKACAQKAVIPELELAKNNEPEFTAKVCAFYNKPLAECKPLLMQSSDEQLGQILQGYLLHGIVIPACGTPDEAK